MFDFAFYVGFVNLLGYTEGRLYRMLKYFTFNDHSQFVLSVAL